MHNPTPTGSDVRRKVKMHSCGPPFSGICHMGALCLGPKFTPICKGSTLLLPEHNVLLNSEPSLKLIPVHKGTTPLLLERNVLLATSRNGDLPPAILCDAWPNRSVATWSVSLLILALQSESSIVFRKYLYRLKSSSVLIDYQKFHLGIGPQIWTDNLIIYSTFSRNIYTFDKSRYNIINTLALNINI